MTKIVDPSTASDRPFKQRHMSTDDWIERHASGTLRKNKRMGWAWSQQYMQERVAYEFGWEFECLAQSRVLEGKPITEGDAHVVTESGWHIERYIERRPFEEDVFAAAYLNITYVHDEVKEGVGIIVKETSAPWIPKGHIVFAIVGIFDVEKKDWSEVNNPF